MKDFKITQPIEGAYKGLNQVQFHACFEDLIELSEEDERIEPRISIENLNDDVIVLNQEHVKRLLPLLAKFVETGKIV